MSEPYAEVQAVGRWTWRIVIRDGISVYGPAMSGMVVGWHVMGRKRAQRKADRELARYVNRRVPEAFVVGLNKS